MSDPGDPLSVLHAHLGMPPGTPMTTDTPPAGDAQRPHATSYSGGPPYTADLTTLRVLKQRSLAGRHLYAVAYRDSDGHEHHDVVLLEQDADQHWHVRGRAGGSGDDPDLGRPWVNLGGGGWPGQFYAGGRVCGLDDHAAHVTLRSANGIALTDDALDRVVLFLADPGQSLEPPIRIELRAADGELLADDSFVD